MLLKNLKCELSKQMLEKIIPMDLFDTGWPQTFNLEKKRKKKKTQYLKSQ